METFDRSLRTEQFIDTDFGSWYDQGLPPVLAAQCPNGMVVPETLHGFAGAEIVDFENELTNALVAAHEPRNTYHGLLHAQRVTENTAKAYDALEDAHHITIPVGFLQPVLLGTAGHDHAHPGTTFFADAAPERVPVDADADMAVEWYSAKLASERLARIGGTLGQQAVAAYVPAASAYGEHEPQGKRLRLARATHPKGIAGLIMRAVDVTPSAGDFAVTTAEETAISHGEKPRQARPQTVEQYCQQPERFLQGYVLPTYDALDAAVRTDLTDTLGWRRQVGRRLLEAEALRRDGMSVQRALLQSRLKAVYNHSLAA